MNDDIENRLRTWWMTTGDPLFAEAASEIGRLRELITEWDAAVKEWASGDGSRLADAESALHREAGK